MLTIIIKFGYKLLYPCIFKSIVSPPHKLKNLFREQLNRFTSTTRPHLQLGRLYVRASPLLHSPFQERSFCQVPTKAVQCLASHSST